MFFKEKDFIKKDLKGRILEFEKFMAAIREKIEHKFKLTLKHRLTEKANSIPTTQLYYLEAKVLDKTLLPTLEKIFSKHLKKVNDCEELEYYISSLTLADNLLKMVKEKMTSLNNRTK